MLRVVNVTVPASGTVYVDAPANSKLYGVGSETSVSSSAVAAVCIDIPGEPDFRISVNARAYMFPAPIPIGDCTKVGVTAGTGSAEYVFQVLFEI